MTHPDQKGPASRWAPKPPRWAIGIQGVQGYLPKTEPTMPEGSKGGLVVSGSSRPGLAGGGPVRRHRPQPFLRRRCRRAQASETDLPGVPRSPGVPGLCDGGSHRPRDLGRPHRARATPLAPPGRPARLALPSLLAPHAPLRCMGVQEEPPCTSKFPESGLGHSLSLAAVVSCMDEAECRVKVQTLRRRAPRSDRRQAGSIPGNDP